MRRSRITAVGPVVPVARRRAAADPAGTVAGQVIDVVGVPHPRGPLGRGRAGQAVQAVVLAGVSLPRRLRRRHLPASVSVIGTQQGH